MKQIKYGSRVFLLTIFSILSHSASASIMKGQCGGIIFQGKKQDNRESPTPKYRLYYKEENKLKKLFYEGNDDVLQVACIQDKNKHDLLLLEEFCSGSACSDVEGVYSLYDPSTKKMLIKSEDWSYGSEKQIAEIKNNRLYASILRFWKQTSFLL
jgi:hypothetical protein